MAKIGRSFSHALSHSHAQSRAVSAVIDEINARFGKGSIMYLSAQPIKM
jgi:hypothetical protein